MEKTSEPTPTQVFRMQSQLRDLDKISGDGTTLISLYCPPKASQFLKLNQMLNEEQGTASCIKSRVTRQRVTDALKSIQQRLKSYSPSTLPANGFAVFCGADQRTGKQELTVVEGLRPINVVMYRCDKRFYTDPLHDQCTQNDKYGFVLIDGKGGSCSVLAGTRPQMINDWNVTLPKKHGRGGSSSGRFARLCI